MGVRKRLRVITLGAFSCIQRAGLDFLFAPLVEPTEVFAMPHHGILWLEDPVILVREYQKS